MLNNIVQKFVVNDFPLSFWSVNFADKEWLIYTFRSVKIVEELSDASTFNIGYWSAYSDKGMTRNEVIEFCLEFIGNNLKSDEKLHELIEYTFPGWESWLSFTPLPLDPFLSSGLLVDMKKSVGLG